MVDQLRVGLAGVGADLRWMLIAWAIIAAVWAGWLALLLACWVHRDRAAPALIRRRRLWLYLRELTMVPELVRAYRRGQGARGSALLHPLDAVIGRRRARRGMSLCLSTLCLANCGLALALGVALESSLLPLLAVLWPLAALPLALLPRLIVGLRRRWSKHGERRGWRGQVTSVARAMAAGRRAAPVDWWTAVDDPAFETEPPDLAAAARLRCLDRAWRDRPADRLAVVSAETRLCREILGLPDERDELTALLTEPTLVLTAEAQLRLLAARLAEPTPDGWRAPAVERAYALLASLWARLDGPASWRLGGALAVATGDREHQARLTERLRAETAAGPSPEPLLGPLWLARARSIWPDDDAPTIAFARLDPEPSALMLGQSLPGISAVWATVARGLTGAELADLINQLRDHSRYPRLPGSVIAVVCYRWAADPRRSDPGGLEALLDYAAELGGMSIVAASALCGLTDALARYHAPAVANLLARLEALAGGMDPRVVLPLEVALAHAAARADADAGEVALWRAFTRLAEAPWSRRTMDLMVLVLDALSVARSPRAAARLRLAGNGLLARLPAHLTTRRLGGREDQVLAAIRALRRRCPDHAEGLSAELRARVGAAESSPASAERLARLAATGDGPSLQRALDLARRAHPTPGESAEARRRRLRRLLTCVAEGALRARVAAEAVDDAREPGAPQP